MAAKKVVSEKVTIDAQAWHELCVTDKQMIVKSLFHEVDGYHVILSDLANSWEEKLPPADIISRLKVLNPSVEVPLSVLLNHLSKALTSPQSTTKYRLSHDRSHEPSSTPLTLSLSTTLSSLPFQWNFECFPVGQEQLSAHLTTPLVCMVGELLRRQSELVKLLKLKDKEIQDFKDHGAKVSRKHLETAAFDEKQFHNDMCSDASFTTSSLLPLATLSNQGFQDLYKDVAAVRRNQFDEDGLTGLDERADSPPPPPSHPHTLTAPTPETTTKKDDENERREMLEKKLEDEKLKPKKKKRKLM